MTEIVDVAEAADKLDQLVDRALAGEDVVIARNGTLVIRLVPALTRKRKPFNSLAIFRARLAPCIQVIARSAALRSCS